MKLFTQYLSILSGIAVHTKVHPVGTMPLPLIPEDSIVYDAKQYNMNLAILVTEENSRALNNYVFVPESYNVWKDRNRSGLVNWERYNLVLNYNGKNCLC